eukprot:TRINITY_DN9260_c0_g1_i3.p1 TRINITY_DN9260_c0_g1~~TRINITY_DN9260_c0_g1_i3.p1  ORF type:complete len:228 (-),score=63.59 TRINITY_DN9260_c0_g1_i3:268-951(-)
MDGHNQWPTAAQLPRFQRVMLRYYHALAQLAARIMAAIALSLNLPRDHFASDFTPHTSFLRLNHYPQCPRPREHFAVNRHTDAGALTVLLQQYGITSLQVNHGGSGRWVGIEPVEGAFTINVGDMLQVWSNDLYKAPEHRVLANSQRDRISAPFFYNPSYAATVKPLGLCLGPQACQVDPHYRPINWGEYRRRRFEGDYANVGEEVQIAHFRVSGDTSTADVTAAEL